MARVTTPIAGVDLTEVIAGTGTSSDEGNEFALGTRVQATDGQEYIYVHASDAITQYMFVGIDENYEAAPLTKAMADDGYSVGVAQVAFADNEFGWVAIRGHNLTGRVAASCAADVALYTTGTAGVLDDNPTSQTNIDGVVVVSANTITSAANEEVLLTWPRSTTF